MNNKEFMNVDSLDDIRNIVEALKQELALLKLYLSYFEAVTKNSKNCSYLFQEDVLGGAFGIIEQSMFTSLVIGFARLYDKEKIWGNKTLGYNSLRQICKDKKDILQKQISKYNIENIDNKLKEFDNRFDEIKDIIDKIKKYRDKYYAHNDCQAHLEKLDIEGFSVEDFYKLYGLMFDFIRYINVCINNAYLDEYKYCDWFDFMFSKLPEAMQLLYNKYSIKRGRTDEI